MAMVYKVLKTPFSVYRLGINFIFHLVRMITCICWQLLPAPDVKTLCKWRVAFLKSFHSFCEVFDLVACPALPSSPPHLFCEYRFSAQRGLIDLARAPARATWLRPVLKHLAKKEIPSLPSRRCKGWICISSSCVRRVSSISEDLVAVGQIWRWPLKRPHATFHSAIILENPHWHHTLRNTCVLSKEQYWMQRGVAKYHVVIFEFVFSEFSEPHPQSSKPSVNNPNVLSQCCCENARKPKVAICTVCIAHTTHDESH